MIKYYGDRAVDGSEPPELRILCMEKYLKRRFRSTFSLIKEIRVAKRAVTMSRW